MKIDWKSVVKSYFIIALGSVIYALGFDLFYAPNDVALGGITGLAQVNGRNAISWEQKFAYDVQYVDNITFLGDWKIMIQTVGKVFKREGITSATSVTMEEFRGTEVEVAAHE